MHCQRCGQPTEPREVGGRSRPVCPACGTVTYQDPKLAACVVILRRKAGRTEVLLGRRGAGTRNPGTWSFPAGFIDRGEHVEDAAVREVQEETGLTITLGPLLGVWSAKGESTVLLAWRAATVTGTAMAADDLASVAWFHTDDPPDLGFAHDRDILQRALTGWPGSRQP